MIAPVLLLVLFHQIEKTTGSNIIQDYYTVTVPKQKPICDDFIKPITISKNEFSIQSPKYPQKYPTNIDCVHIIQAPGPNTIIHIGFREKFELEESRNCFSDFLQINDGPFGFSKRLTKLCGKETGKGSFQSTGPYLWLRFYSDSTIINQGFKLIYKFVSFPSWNQRISKICYRTISIPNGHSILLNSNDMKKYRTNDNFRGIQECVFDINVEEKTNIFLAKFKLNTTGMTVLNQFIELYDKITTPIASKMKRNYVHINGKSGFDKFFFRHQRAVVRVVFRNIESIMTFQFVLTALVKKSNINCSEEEYRCEGSFCISNKLVCNNMKNCPALDDERCVNGKPLFNMKSIPISSTVDNGISKDKDGKKGEADSVLHSFILGAISIILFLMLMGCIIHSIREGKLSPKNIPKPAKGTTSVGLRNSAKVEDESPIRRPLSSTMTLTTDVLSKKIYNHTKSKDYLNKHNRFEYEPYSVNPKSLHFFENGNLHSVSNFPSQNSSSPESQSFSKSTSNVNKYNYYSQCEHLPGCKSLPNFSAESVNNLFEDENHPSIEADTVRKPVRIKYYA